MTNSKPKATTVAKSVTIPVTFKSILDIGYNAAKYADTGSILVKALVDQNIGWPNEVSDDNMALLKSGIVLRKHEITPACWFRVEAKNLIALPGPPELADLKAKGASFLKLDVNYAMAVTPHQLGTMKESHPAEYTVLVEVRKATSKYVSNVIGRLKAMTKAMADTERNRGVTKPIREKVEAFFKDLKRSNALARDNRGDPTAFDDTVLDHKVAAFWKAE